MRPAALETSSESLPCCRVEKRGQKAVKARHAAMVLRELSESEWQHSFVSVLKLSGSGSSKADTTRVLGDVKHIMVRDRYTREGPREGRQTPGMQSCGAVQSGILFPGVQGCAPRALSKQTIRSKR